jgi:hypothetical protein
MDAAVASIPADGVCLTADPSPLFSGVGRAFSIFRPPVRIPGRGPDGNQGGDADSSSDDA